MLQASSEFKVYYVVKVIEIVLYWQRNRHLDQWNRIQNSEIDPHKYTQPIFDKGTKTIGYPQAKMWSVS